MASDDINGLILTGSPGSSSDLAFMTPAGVPILRNPTGTPHIEALGNFSALGAVKFPSLGAGFVLSNPLGELGLAPTINLSAADVSGMLPIARGGTGSATAVDAINALLPAQAGNAGKTLATDGTNIIWQTAGGFSITANSAQFNPNDSSTYYFGVFASLPMTTTAGVRRQYIPRPGIVRACVLNWFANSAIGSAESFTMYIRHNNSTDYAIAAVATAAAQKIFLNTALSIAVAAGDYIEIKLITPAWSNNPTQVNIGGTIFIE